MEVRSLDTIDGLRIWIKAWQISKKQWGQLLLVAAISSTLVIVSFFIPYIGLPLASALTGLLGYGFICIGQEIRKHGQFSFKTMFCGFEKDSLKKLRLLIVIWIMAALTERVACYFVATYTDSVRLSYYVEGIILFIGASLLLFAAPLMGFHGQRLGDAIQMTFEAVFKNIGTVFTYFLGLISMVMLSLLPMYIGLRYVDPNTILWLLVACVSLMVSFTLFLIVIPSFIISTFIFYEEVFLKGSS